MSLSADHMRMLLDGGRDIADLLIMAEAMERGDDYRAIASVIDQMRRSIATPKQIADVAMIFATELVERNRAYVHDLRDEHTGARDSNKSRRGLSNEAWKELRLSILERDAFACTYCSATEDLTCDHIVPLVRGGTNDPENLTTACRSCNSSKGGKLLSEWRPERWA